MNFFQDKKSMKFVRYFLDKLIFEIYIYIIFVVYFVYKQKWKK